MQTIWSSCKLYYTDETTTATSPTMLQLAVTGLQAACDTVYCGAPSFEQPTASSCHGTWQREQLPASLLLRHSLYEGFPAPHDRNWSHRRRLLSAAAGRADALSAFDDHPSSKAGTPAATALGAYCGRKPSTAGLKAARGLGWWPFGKW